MKKLVKSCQPFADFICSEVKITENNLAALQRSGPGLSLYLDYQGAGDSISDWTSQSWLRNFKPHWRRETKGIYSISWMLLSPPLSQHFLPSLSLSRGSSRIQSGWSGASWCEIICRWCELMRRRCGGTNPDRTTGGQQVRRRRRKRQNKGSNGRERWKGTGEGRT